MVKFREYNGVFLIMVEKTSKFEEITQYLKQNRFFWVPDCSAWSNDVLSKIKEAILDIGDYDDINVPDDFLEKLDLAINPPLKITARRLKIVDEIITKFPPKYPYQLDPIKKGLALGSFLNADDTGTGKTYETIQIINHLIHYNIIESVFIITEPATLFNWKEELLSFSDNFKESDIFIVSKDNRDVFDNLEFVSKIKVFICSYNSFGLLSDHCYKNTKNYAIKKRKIEKEKLANPKYRTPTLEYLKPPIPLDSWNKKPLLVCDEVHLIKNHSAIRTKKVLMHRKFFVDAILMSATAWSEDISYLWSQSKLINEDICPGPYNDWIRNMANLGGRSEYSVESYKPKEVERFHDRIKPFIIKRQKRELIPDLTDIYEKNCFIELSAMERKIYQGIISEELSRIKEEAGYLSVDKVFNKFPYIMMAINNITYYKDKIISDSGLSELINNFKFEDHSKVKMTKNIVESVVEEDRRIIIWDMTPKTLDSLGVAFKEFSPLVIHGENTPKGIDANKFRHDMIREFKDNKKIKVGLFNPVVLSTGINMPYISDVLYYTKPDSYTYYYQSKGRVDRIVGQDNDINYYNVLALKTIEMSREKARKKKMELDIKFFKKDSLSKEEWLALFNGESSLFDFE